MIYGTVTSFREATIPLRIYGLTGIAQDIVAAIDTGFTDYLTLPHDIILNLQFPPAGSTRVMLADGSYTWLGLFSATVDWDGTSVDITVLEADGGPLVGMSLLSGFAVYLEVVDGGNVEVSRLPGPP